MAKSLDSDLEHGLGHSPDRFQVSMVTAQFPSHQTIVATRAPPEIHFLFQSDKVSGCLPVRLLPRSPKRHLCWSLLFGKSVAPDDVLRIRTCTVERELLTDSFYRRRLFRTVSRNCCVRDSNPNPNPIRGAGRLQFDSQATSKTTIGADQVDPIIKSGVLREHEEGLDLKMDTHFGLGSTISLH